MELFRVNAIDGQELISMDNKTLVDLGVAALGHRNKIMRGLQKVNEIRIGKCVQYGANLVFASIINANWRC